MNNKKFKLTQSRLDEIILEEVKRVQQIKSLKTEKTKLLKEMHELYSEMDLEEGKKEKLFPQRLAQIQKIFAQYPDVIAYLNNADMANVLFTQISTNKNKYNVFWQAVKEDTNKAIKYLDFWKKYYGKVNAQPIWDTGAGQWTSQSMSGRGGGGILGPFGE